MMHMHKKSCRMSKPLFLLSALILGVLLGTSLVHATKGAELEAEAAEAKKATGAKKTVPSPIASVQKTGEKEDHPETSFDFKGDMKTRFHFRNDSDFDPSERFDDLDGQTDAQLATFFQPTLTARPGGGVTARYQLVVGWNAWSRNDPGQPNQFFNVNTPGLVARHTQAWAQWRGDRLKLRAGFQQVKDPTGLFLNHTMGAVTAQLPLGTQRLTLIAGQLPETTIEGLDIRQDNLMTDSFVFGITHRAQLSRASRLDTGVYLLHDRRLIGRVLNLGAGAVNWRMSTSSMTAWAGLVGQYGQWSNAALGGGDVTHSSFAAHAGVQGRSGKLQWGVGSFALSADDDFDGNEVQGAFFGAAKNQSPSVFLTEDEERDRYDNLDERLGSYWGAFAFSPAGVSVSDLMVGYQVTSWLTSRLVAASAFTLNAKRSYGASYVGTELSLLQKLTLSERASLSLNALVFLPGEAGAAMINDLDRTATQILYGGSTSFAVSF